MDFLSSLVGFALVIPRNEAVFTYTETVQGETTNID
jgi:hypothetical protein